MLPKIEISLLIETFSNVVIPKLHNNVGFFFVLGVSIVAHFLQILVFKNQKLVHEPVLSIQEKCCA